MTRADHAGAANQLGPALWAELGQVGPSCPKPLATGLTNSARNSTRPVSRGLGGVWPGNSTRPTQTLRARLGWAMLPRAVENNEITRSVEENK